MNNIEYKYYKSNISDTIIRIHIDETDIYDPTIVEVYWRGTRSWVLQAPNNRYIKFKNWSELTLQELFVELL